VCDIKVEKSLTAWDANVGQDGILPRVTRLGERAGQVGSRLAKPARDAILPHKRANDVE